MEEIDSIKDFENINITEVCRACFKTCKQYKVLVDEAENTDKQTLGDVFVEVVKIDIKTDAKLKPSRLCLTCCYDLTSAYNFIQKSQKNNELLVQYLKYASIKKHDCLHELPIDVPIDQSVPDFLQIKVEDETISDYTDSMPVEFRNSPENSYDSDGSDYQPTANKKLKIEKLQCAYCTQLIESKNCENHMRTMHPEECQIEKEEESECKVLECELCDFCSTSELEMKKHENAEHKTRKIPSFANLQPLKNRKICMKQPSKRNANQLFPTKLITSPLVRTAGSVKKKLQTKDAEKCHRWRSRKRSRKESKIEQHETEALRNQENKNYIDQELPHSVTSSLISSLDEVLINKSPSLPLYNHFEVKKTINNAERCRKYKKRRKALEASMPTMSTLRKQKKVKVDLVLKKVENLNSPPSDPILNPDMCEVNACDDLDISRSCKPGFQRTMTNAERCRQYRTRIKALKEGIPMTTRKYVRKQKHDVKQGLVLKKVADQNPLSSCAFTNPEICTVVPGPSIKTVSVLNKLDVSRSLKACNSIVDKVKANPHASSLKPGKQKDVKLVFIKVGKANPSTSSASLNSDNSALIPASSIESVTTTDNVDISRPFKPAFKGAKTNAEKCRQNKLRKKAAA